MNTITDKKSVIIPKIRDFLLRWGKDYILIDTGGPTTLDFTIQGLEPVALCLKAMDSVWVTLRKADKKGTQNVRLINVSARDCQKLLDCLPVNPRIMEYKGYPLLHGIEGQRFKATLTIVTECDETMSVSQIREWLGDQFEGCDLGRVVVGVCEASESNYTIDHTKCTDKQIRDAFLNNGAVMCSNSGYVEREIEMAFADRDGIIMYYSHNHQGTMAYYHKGTKGDPASGHRVQGVDQNG